MKYLLLLPLCVLGLAKASGQDDSPEKLVPEFIHLTTDKPFYFEEERLIFQAVALSNKTFKVVKRNDVIYSELLNARGETIGSARFLWVNGVASGEFRLPLLFDEQAIHYLHVFTPSLLNNTEWVEASIPISTYQIPSSAIEENSIAQLATKEEPGLVISPDNGRIYSHLPNQVFFRVTNPEPGIAYKLTVERENESKETVSTDGELMGDFIVNPTTTKPIGLQLWDNATVVASTTIQPVEMPGITLEVATDSAKNLELKIYSTFDLSKKVELEIRQGDLLAFKRIVSINQPIMTMLVPASASERTAAYSIIVRDEAKKLLIERFVFVEDPIEERLKWINQRGKLPSGSTPNLLFMVNVDSIDFSETYLSVKLVDERLPTLNGNNLRTSGQTYATYQLKRAGIFSDDVPLAFDDLAASQKEAWVQTNRSKVTIKPPVLVSDSIQLAPDPFQKGFRITGRITFKETGEPLQYCPLALANTSDFSLFRFAKTTKDGFFKFENLTFEGENELFLALQKYYDHEVDIVIDQPVFPQFKMSVASPPKMVSRTKTALLNEALERSIIDSVYTGTSDVVKVFQENNFISKIAGFFLEPTEVIDPLVYVPFNEMKDVFKEILPSAYLRFKKGKPLIRMVHNTIQLPSNAVVTGLMDVPALVIVDGVPIFNQAEVLSINPALVTKYELYHGLFTLGHEVYLGLVHIVTNVDYLNQKKIKGLHKFKYMGVNASNPIAIGPKGEANSPYLSPVGFWVTNINPDDKGVVQLPIRLTSVPGDYWLMLEVVTPNGRGMVEKWPLQIE
ncbi:MAG: hypothetical protein RIE86_09585 [Imperialibacter sp.]|uniref:hypothetical protein n=1 Tax=Imperialibacter sp. TaxID=2038411 RepID=UPI0032EEFD35